MQVTNVHLKHIKIFKLQIVFKCFFKKTGAWELNGAIYFYFLVNFLTAKKIVFSTLLKWLKWPEKTTLILLLYLLSLWAPPCYPSLHSGQLWGKGPLYEWVLQCCAASPAGLSIFQETHTHWFRAAVWDC